MTTSVSGAAIIACPEGSLQPGRIELVRLIVSQNAGALGRAMQHEEEVSALRGRVDAAAGLWRPHRQRPQDAGGL